MIATECARAHDHRVDHATYARATHALGDKGVVAIVRLTSRRVLWKPGSTAEVGHREIFG